MKRFIAVLPVLIIAIVLIVSVAGCDSPLIDLSALTDNNGTITDPNDEDYPDKLYTGDESSAELVLFRAGDVYFTYSRDKNYWVSLIGNVPDTMSLNDGEFALITADIKRYSGGIAGYMGNPSIVKLISYEPMTYDRAVTFCGLKDYCSELFGSGEPLICGDQLSCAGRVYRDGKLVGEYNTQLEAEAAMGIRVIADTQAEMTDEGEHRVYVFRCGGTYLAYVGTGAFNRYWTPLLNEDFENKLRFIDLNDGEAAYLTRAHLIKVNGGKAGYVNAPMIISAESAELVSYDVLTDYMPPFWGKHQTQGEGNEVVDWIDRADFSESCNAMFDRYNGTWLIFLTDGRFYVYFDDYTEKKQIAVCEKEYEVEKIMTEFKKNGGKL